MLLEPWTKRRRDDLLKMREELDVRIAELDLAIATEARRWEKAVLLMSHPGVGPITALATVVTLGDVGRFLQGKHVASYLGLIPRENSSGERRRLGSISKQGNSFMRFLLVQAGVSAARGDAELGRVYKRLCHKKHHGVAKVAIARKLVVRLYWMLRRNTPYPEVVRMQGSSSHPVAEVAADRLSEHPVSRRPAQPDSSGQEQKGQRGQKAPSAKKGNHGSSSQPPSRPETKP